MRAALVAVVLTLAALPAAAGEGLSLDLSAVLPPVDLAARDKVAEATGADLSQAELDREFRLALWSSPLGRVHYQMVSEQAMLGREGLVGGGHMLGVGTSLYALGASQPNPRLVPTREHPWREWSTREKVEAVTAGGLIAAILWQLAANAD
jgi:hypothetical protein